MITILRRNGSVLGLGVFEETEEIKGLLALHGTGDPRAAAAGAVGRERDPPARPPRVAPVNSSSAI